MLLRKNTRLDPLVAGLIIPVIKAAVYIAAGIILVKNPIRSGFSEDTLQLYLP